MWRAVAAGTAVVVAAASGIITALVTGHPNWGLWVALGVLVVVGAALQVAVTAWKRLSASRNEVTASGLGSVAIGGDITGRVHTRTWPPTEKPDSPGPMDGLGGDQPGD
jgi:hypothetical protein